jgi:hypothetical protein
MAQPDYIYAAWPSWAFGPNGESAIFQSEEDVPNGWEHHGEVKGGKAAKPVGGSKSQLDDDIGVLRAAYKSKFGKKPFGGWDAETLKAKLA